MKWPGRGLPVASGSFLAVLSWLYLGDVADWWRGRSAEVAAMPELPRLGFALGVLLAAVGAGGVFAAGVLQARPASWRGFRLLPIVGVVALFVDLFVLSSSRALVSSPDELSMAMRAFGQHAGELSRGGWVPHTVEELSSAVAELGAPPYLVRGEQVRAYALQVRTECEGPVTQAEGVGAGTFIYCVAKDRRSAWLTAVALPAEERFGPPAVFSVRGRPVMVEVAEPSALIESVPSEADAGGH
ncbi:MAG: hypothetical protein ACOZIN_14420 [Myxococcota bacterium]